MVITPKEDEDLIWRQSLALNEMLAQLGHPVRLLVLIAEMKEVNFPLGGIIPRSGDPRQPVNVKIRHKLGNSQDGAIASIADLQ
jgi:hypothetical protein